MGENNTNPKEQIIESTVRVPVRVHVPVLVHVCAIPSECVRACVRAPVRPPSSPSVLPPAHLSARACVCPSLRPSVLSSVCARPPARPPLPCARLHVRSSMLLCFALHVHVHAHNTHTCVRACVRTRFVLSLGAGLLFSRCCPEMLCSTCRQNAAAPADTHGSMHDYTTSSRPPMQVRNAGESEAQASKDYVLRVGSREEVDARFHGLITAIAKVEPPAEEGKALPLGPRKKV